jgi:hypothetical protein
MSANKVTPPARTFTAHWVAKWTQDMADAGLDPLYAAELGFSSLGDAHQFACAMGRKAGQMEWTSVTEREWDARRMKWKTVARYTGDYEALEVVPC